jgi:hypothetical protein
VARDQRPRLARAVWDDRDRHGALEPDRGRATAGDGGQAAARCGGAATRRERTPADEW